MKSILEDFSHAYFHELKSLLEYMKGDLLARASEARAEEEKKKPTLRPQPSTPQKVKKMERAEYELRREATKEIKFSHRSTCHDVRGGRRYVFFGPRPSVRTLFFLPLLPLPSVLLPSSPL